MDQQRPLLVPNSPFGQARWREFLWDVPTFTPMPCVRR